MMRFENDRERETWDSLCRIATTPLRRLLARWLRDAETIAQRNLAQAATIDAYRAEVADVTAQRDNLHRLLDEVAASTRCEATRLHVRALLKDPRRVLPLRTATPVTRNPTQ